MNYRHAYHAGNFADVLKHSVLAIVIEHLKRKPGAFRVIDTHAGIGTYDLTAEEAVKTGEWHDGIGRIWEGAGSAPLPDSIRDILAPYLTAVRSLNVGDDLRIYPGSPFVAKALMRPQDILMANELHPSDHQVLVRRLRGDARARVTNIDGWIALRSMLPPKERRGVVLIDPPFEVEGERERLVSGLKDGLTRFATGTYLLWYPIKELLPVAAMKRDIVALGAEKLLCAELFVHRPGDAHRLNGCGLLMINPPYQLDERLRVLLPFLVERLGQSPGACFELTWLAAEGTGARGKRT